MIKSLIILLFISLPVHASEKAKISKANIEDDRGSADEYKILKLETKINDLRLEVQEMKVQMEELDLIQSQLLAKLNGMMPKEDQEIINAHLDPNIEEFKYGFDMLQSGNFERAKRSFELFIEKYPEDDKLGEAHFWLGEVSYKAKDYKEASRSYLISYRDYKENPRRNDALFKLSVVLGLLDKKDEACAGFDILINDTAGVADSIRSKSKGEAINLGCYN